MPFHNIDSRRIFYVLHEGQGEKKPYTFLFVHGLGSSHAFYETIIPKLTAAGLDCLAFDLPGSGLSDVSPESSIDGYAKDAENLIGALNIAPRNVIAVGHSMGSLVVSTLASKVDVAGIALIGGIQPSKAFAEAMAKRIQAVTQNGMEAMADTIPKAATGSRATPLHHAFIRALLLSQKPEGYNSLCNSIATANSPEYEAITARVLAIAGEEDQTAKLEGLQDIMKRCSSATSTSLETLPGVGHWHCIEAPEKAASLLENFAR